jgi:glycosidase
MRYRLAGLLLCAGVLTLEGPVQACDPRPIAPPDTSWVARSTLYEVFVQDFSARGDFQGVTDGLDRIQQAGANVVWVMPIHPIGVLHRKGVLGSPYAALDYRAINPAYGTAREFQALVTAVHARGMKLILDWVPDHTSPDNPWVREHPEYYVHDEHGNPSVPRDPDGKLTDWDDVVQLDYHNPGLRRAMIETMRYWLEEFDLDGFRVDVAGFVPVDFWREAIPELRGAVSRRILLLAESGDPELIRAGFDLIYAWDSRRRLIEVWDGKPAGPFIDHELSDVRGTPASGTRMRFTTNHDETAWENPPVTIFHGDSGARAAFVAEALLPGRPLLYNGQEVDSPQKLPLFSREVVAWDQPEASEARGFYARVMELARTDSAFVTGDFRVVRTSSPDDLIAYARGDALVLVNPRGHPVRATIEGFSAAGARDLLTGQTLSVDTLGLPGYGAMVLRGASR